MEKQARVADQGASRRLMAKNGVVARPVWLHIPEWLTGDTWHFPYACETFEKYIPPQSLALEIGFGSGRMITRIARDLNCRCVGVDLDGSAFPCLSYFSRQAGIETEPIRGSGLCLPFKDNSFDAVYSEGVIEHFPLAQSHEMLAEHARVCRRGGVVVVSVPNRFAVVHQVTKLLMGEGFLFYPEASLSIFELCRLMASVGLKPVERNGFAFGCQFYLFQTLFLDQASPKRLSKGALRLLSMLIRTGLYHFQNPVLNSLIGFQVLAVGHKC